MPKNNSRDRFLKKSEAKALLAEGAWHQDPEFSRTYCTGYTSDKGELLIMNHAGRSVLYASRDQLKKEMAAIEKGPRSTHILEGLLPQGPHFIEAVPSLVDELAKQLRIPREALDNSFDSLALVETALNKIRPRKRILEISNLFPGVIAYTGEVYRHLTNGHWHLNEVAGGIWEPYVHNEDESDYLCPFVEPYKDIAERRRGGVMLRPLVSASLRSFSRIVH